MENFKIHSNGIKRIEKELNLYNSSNTRTKRYSEEEYRAIQQLIENKYTLPYDCVQIKDSKDYASPQGDIYKESGNTGLYFKAKTTINQGYVYCGIKYNNTNITKRVHRIIAETFLSNLEGKDQVNHIDGNKLNNNINNLEWVTASENTKHAFDNGLAINTKGFEDSQSIAVNKYDLEGKILKEYGSMREASKEENIPLSTILNQCKNKTYPRKYNFYFRYTNK